MFEVLVDHKAGKPPEKSSDQIGVKEELELELVDRILADGEFAERFTVSASKL
tara:strand:+ start:1664 stop:1822 length:159 start_codon:yes stop_codon:yes gene_type:complete